MRAAALVLAVGCASTTTVSTAPTPPPSAARAVMVDEQVRRAEITTAHHALEDEQISAFAATCAKPPHSEQRCTPSCYAAEAADPRSGRKLGEIVHHVCTDASANPTTGPFAIVDELGGEVVATRRIPTAAKKGTWQAVVETDVAAALRPMLAHGDTVRVTGAWAPVTHPITFEHLRCVTVSHFTRARSLYLCGAHGEVACEASGNAAVHGVNVIHYRLAEAKRLHASGKDAACDQAALEAIAVSRGLPRWRQYVTLNVNQWKSFARYRTRFDGLLDEDTLFATATALGVEAQTACGSPNAPKTTAANEQSFHTCW